MVDENESGLTAINLTKLELSELLEALTLRQSELRRYGGRQYSEDGVAERLQACALVAYKLGRSHRAENWDAVNALNASEVRNWLVAMVKSIDQGPTLEPRELREAFTRVADGYELMIAMKNAANEEAARGR